MGIDKTEGIRPQNHAGTLRLSFREQSEKRPPFSDVWSSTEALDSHIPTVAQTVKEKNVLDTGEKSRKQQNMPNNTVQLPPHVLQNLCANEAVARSHESCSELKPRESQSKTPGRDFSKETDLVQSRLVQSVSGEAEFDEMAPSPANDKVKSECGPDPDLVAIKEEEEMLPVWDCRGDDTDGDTDPNHAGSWSRDKSQVDNFPNLTALDMPDPSSHLMSYSVDCNAQISQRIKAELIGSVNTDLVHPALPPVLDRVGSLDHNENGHLFELCPGEKLFLPVPLPNSFSKSEALPAREKSFPQLDRMKVHTAPLQIPLSCTQCNKTFVHATELKEHQQQQHSKDRPHVCSTCGKAFTRFGNFKQHQNIHTHEKLFNCTYCGMRFKRSTHLRIHLRRHGQIGKSCPCRQCGKTFVCPRQLKGHLLKVHGTEMN